jgi:hypothetical protein
VNKKGRCWPHRPVLLILQLSCFIHWLSVCIAQFIRSDASRLANSVNRIPRAPIKIVEGLQRARSVLGCFSMNNLLELLS